jgi:hypothetical protein
MGLAGLCPDRRQTGNYPETGLGEINSHFREADFWPVDLAEDHEY